MRINASSVSSLMMINGYGAFHDVMVHIMKANCPHVLENIRDVDSDGCTTSHDRVVQALEKTCSLTLEKMAGTPEEHFLELSQTLGVREDDVRNAVYTERGKLRESESINDFEQEFQKLLSNRNIKQFQKTYESAQRREILLCGRIDGFDVDDCRVVESKNRQRGFLGVTASDMVQCHIYMELTNTRECTLIERLEGAQSYHSITFCPNFWGSILTFLDQFVDRFYAMCSHNRYSSMSSCVAHMYDLILSDTQTTLPDPQKRRDVRMDSPPPRLLHGS